MFSNPENPEKEFPTINCTTSSIEDLKFSIDDIQDAIDEIDKNSGTSDNDIPAAVLKKCKLHLSYPIFLIWEHSFKSGIIPPDLKLQNITPSFKKGDKSKASNYRPI